MTYLEGNKTSLLCNATNDVDAVNHVKIDWFYKKLTSIYPVVPDKSNVIIYTEKKFDKQTYSILLFDPVNRTDEGVYICKASNDPLSYTELSTKVTIKSKLACS